MADVYPTSQSCFICRQFVEILEEWKSSNLSNDIGIEWERLDANTLFLPIQEPLPIDERGRKGAYTRLFLNVEFEDDLLHRGEDECFGERTFQRCHDQPVDVNDFCKLDSLTDWDVNGAHPFEARTRPLVANTKLFLKWMETCCVRHGSSCTSDVVDIGSATLRFVDVEMRNVVDGQRTDKYFALSYLWGSGGTLYG
jgi:hypothetical protein